MMSNPQEKALDEKPHVDEFTMDKEIARTHTRAKFKLLMHERYAHVVLICSFLTAVLYSISFSGLEVLPQLSFFAFCGAALCILYFGLKKLNWLVSRKAFLWGILIMTLAGFNAVFEISVFHYFNGIVVTFLFALIAYTAAGGRDFDVGAPSFWLNVLKIIRSHFTAGFAIINTGRKASRLTKDSVAFRVIMGIILAFPVGGIIVALMLSADAVFAVLVSDFFADIVIRPARILWHIIVVVFMTGYFAGWLYSVKFKQASNVNIGLLKPDNIIALTFLLVLNIIFAVFCYIQFAFLFTGGANTLPPSITYAEYARTGFFQLLFITIINFSVLIAFLKLFDKLAPAIRLMLLFLAIFTGVLIASSFYRMNMYIDVFGFTPLRLMVITFLTMETFFLAAAIIALFRPKFKLIRFFLVVGMVFFLIANFTSTAYFSGRLNTARHFDNTRQFTFNIANSHFLGVDNAREMIVIYRATDDHHLQFAIRSMLGDLQRRYQNEPWQSRSLIKRINLRHIDNFMH